jgi:hypothetical protein
MEYGLQLGTARGKIGRFGDAQMNMIRKISTVIVRWSAFLTSLVLVATPVRSAPLLLQQLVTPSTVILKDGHPVTFAIHGFIEFQSLSEAFPYIESQRQRWKGRISIEVQQNLASQLLHEAIESRVVSMEDERPLETLITHTSGELRQAIGHLTEPVPAGYLDEFLAVQEKWKHSLNCWSATPSILGRVLSNWYPIEEGIRLYGATYDSTEHFWQSVKYHPDVTVSGVEQLIVQFENADWSAWLKRLDDDPQLYLPNAYAVEFLRHNLTAERMRWFREELARQGLKPSDHARLAQQRGETPFRISGYEEKVLWGDLADVFHLVYLFSSPEDSIRTKLAEEHFDGIYLDGRQLGFISEEFRSQMLEIWKMKYLQMPRFREVISLIPMQIRLEHFLNDGDSPDIPIPIYVGYLNQIREMARRREASSDENL